MKRYIRYMLLAGWVAIATHTFSQTGSQNYIMTKTYTNASGQVSLDQIQYFDGLGRPIQVIQRGITPLGADLATYQEYDSFGREGRSWLPVVASGNNGAFMSLSHYTTKAMATYNSTFYNAAADTVPYGCPVYEASPLNRVLEQYGPGQHWHKNGKSVKTGYQTNKTKSELTWTDVDSLVCGLYKTTDDRGMISLSRTANYSVGELYVTRMKNEEENVSYEFKDKSGQVILIRQINEGKRYDTNYIYDSFGNLRAVLPPEASDILLNSSGWTETDPCLMRYAFLYKYDKYNRCIANKLPGCEWTYYVYDKTDRLIFSQSGEQRLNGEWMFSVPDILGRVCVTGICTNSLNTFSDVVLSDMVIATRNYSQATGTYKGYSVSNITLSNPKLLTVSYYDDYTFLNQTGIPEFNNSNFVFESNTNFDTNYLVTPKTSLTATLIAKLDDSTTSSFLASVMYYDYRSRLIQTTSNNYLNGLEKEFVAYNFTNQPTSRLHIHSASGKATQTELYSYIYDHAGRLTTTKHKLNANGEMLLAFNTYDELGRLRTLNSNSQGTLNRVYGYNIRSWMQNISNTHFRENLTYAYDGNINSQEWVQSGKTRKYTFAYDDLSRLKAVTYTGDGNYGTAYTYDKHGNITSLSRYGNTGTSTHGLIDNLSMTYSGNQLIKVTDTGVTPLISTSADFRSGSAASVQYLYDANGNLKQDLNKGIGNIAYNSLNLPSSFTISNSLGSATNTYVYSADGRKLKVTKGTFTTDYCGNVIYENNVLKRILVDGGYYENGSYYFYLTDHLGNNRVVTNQSGAVIQSTQYYPFGMAFADGTDPSAQPYKFGGKELDSDRGLNLYDFHARWQDAALGGRFLSVDPLAEKYYWISPYVYCGGNPVNRVDPNGMEWKTKNDKEIANQLQKSIENRQTQLTKEEQKINASIEKIQNNGKLSNEKRSKELGKIQGKLDDVKEQRSVLADASTGITQLGDSKTVYTFNTVESGTLPILSSQADGTIVINNSGAIGNRLHETVHAIQYDNGSMSFDPLGANNVIFKDHPTGLEYDAYRTQYSIDRSSMPRSDHGGLKSIFGITPNWIWKIPYNGVYIYHPNNYKK